MGQFEWLVLTCRACRRVIKLAPAMGGKHIICPHCRTKISVPKDAPLIQEEALQNHIPSQRQHDEATSSFRGSSDWEVGRRPIGGDLEFQSRLHTTQDPDMQPGPDKDMKRVNMRRRRLDRTHPDFDDVERHRKHRRKVRSRGAAMADRFTKALIVGVVILLAIVGRMAWKRLNSPQTEGTPAPKMVQAEPPPLTPASDGRPKLETRHYADYGPALAAAVRRFVACKTAEEILPLVRDRTRVAGKITAYYNTVHTWRPMEINNKFSPDDAVAVDGDFIVVSLELPNGDSLPLTLERSGETFLADWEAFTGYGDLTWEEIRGQRPQQPVVLRAVVERGPNTEYWNDAFTNHTTHTCYLLRDAHSDNFLSGYTLKNSEVDLKLLQWIQPEPPPAKISRCYAILEVSCPPGSKDGRQVNIVRVLENGWVYRADK